EQALLPVSLLTRHILDPFHSDEILAHLRIVLPCAKARSLKRLVEDRHVRAADIDHEVLHRDGFLHHGADADVALPGEIHEHACSGEEKIERLAVPLAAAARDEAVFAAVVPGARGTVPEADVEVPAVPGLAALSRRRPAGLRLRLIGIDQPCAGEVFLSV